MKKCEVLLKALEEIANDYIELSHDKVFWQRNSFIKLARKALAEYYNEVGEGK